MTKFAVEQLAAEIRHAASVKRAREYVQFLKQADHTKEAAGMLAFFLKEILKGVGKGGRLLRKVPGLRGVSRAMRKVPIYARKGVGGGRQWLGRKIGGGLQSLGFKDTGGRMIARNTPGGYQTQYQRFKPVKGAEGATEWVPYGRKSSKRGRVAKGNQMFAVGDKRAPKDMPMGTGRIGDRSIGRLGFAAGMAPMFMPPQWFEPDMPEQADPVDNMLTQHKYLQDAARRGGYDLPYNPFLASVLQQSGRIE